MSIPFFFTNIPVPVGFFGVALILFVVYRVVKRSAARQTEVFTNYLEAESDASFARRVDPPSEDYLTVDPHTLPMRTYPDERAYARVKMCQGDAFEMAGLPMLYTVGNLDNRALKLKYGAANLDMIITYEENYSRFIHSLMEWAAALIDIGSTADAVAVLQIAVTYRCDRSQAYTLLAGLLADASELRGLREHAVANLSGAAAARALEKIDQRMEDIT